MRLISKKSVLRILQEEPSYYDTQNAITEIYDKINELPTIEERKTGKWIVITKMDGRTLYECSVCGKRVIFDDLMDLPNYCDHCGARMEGSEEDAGEL